MPQFDGKVANIKIATKEEKQTKNGSVMTKITDEDGKKYSFFNKKKDGTNTAAWLGFKGLSIGDVVEIGFKEEEKSFTGDDGRVVDYTQRTILFANRVVEDGNYNVTPDGKPTNQDEIVITNDDLPFR